MKRKIISLIFTIIIMFTFSIFVNAEESIKTENESYFYESEKIESEILETTYHEESESFESESETLEDVFGNLDNDQKNFWEDFFQNAAPDDVEKIQEIIKSGLESIKTGENTFFDKVTNFALSHVTEASWLIFAISLISYIIVVFKKYKGFEKISMFLNNNAIEISNLCEKTVSEAKEKISENTEKINQNLTDISSTLNANIEKSVSEIHEITNQTLGAIESNKNIIVEALNYIKANEVDKNNMLKMFSSQIAEKEDRISELEEIQESERLNMAKSEMLLADIINELLQLSNIPQAKKDAIFEKYTSAKSTIDLGKGENFENSEQS